MTQLLEDYQNHVISMCLFLWINNCHGVFFIMAKSKYTGRGLHFLVMGMFAGNVLPMAVLASCPSCAKHYLSCLLRHNSCSQGVGRDINIILDLFMF